MSSEETKSVRFAKRGDIVRVATPVTGEDPIEEVVRDVTIVLHLANGTDVRFNMRDQIVFVTDDPIEIPTDVAEDEG